jgi:8-oxo-dGTP pyrophosphatase MutT (NUDIX family)
VEAKAIGAKLKRAAPARSDAPATSTIALRQVAALPFRIGADGAAQVLLVTSRATRRWIIPKGWLMKGLKPCDAAAQEALEEAGVVGRVDKKPIGRYAYFKRREAHFDICEVDVYLLAVEKQAKTWRERGERKAEWFSFEEAAQLVEEPGMVAILRDLARTHLVETAK